jgi:perosamine synthetase
LEPIMPPLISSYQTLGPRAGWKWQGRDELPFPLSHSRIRTYYLGRNAVYHGSRALGLGPGDEIIFPAYHSGTEAAPLLHLGCKLVFHDVRDDFSIDLDEIESKITPATKAIYTIHFFGFPGPIVELRELADRHGLWLIEDVALSMLARRENRPLGTFGDISIFCLYKTAPTAAGGILAINRDDIPLPQPPRHVSLYNDLNLTTKRILAHVEQHGGRITRGAKSLFEVCARKFVRQANIKITAPDALDFDPALLEWDLGPITRRLLGGFDYARIAQRRRANFNWLMEALRGSEVALPRESLSDGAVPLFFPVLVEDKPGTVEKLHQEGIEAVAVWGVHYPYVPREEFPGTEFLEEHLIELPVYQDLTQQHLERIQNALVKHAQWPAAPLWREFLPSACVAVG